MSESSERDIGAFQAALRASRRVLALVGAGLGQASGIAPFRGPNCQQWRGYDQAELSTPEAFCVDPLLVWQFHADCRRRALAAAPNAGHEALARLARAFGGDMLTVTQNFDGLSQRAQHPARHLVALHGDLFRVRCTNLRCGFRATNVDAQLGETAVPRCPLCRHNLRPCVVWFGESVPYAAIVQTNELVEQGTVDLVLCIGISATVWPAAGYISEIVQRGGKVAVFNPECGVKADWFFKGGAEEWLPRALEGFI